jgi:hypothetical protein
MFGSQIGTLELLKYTEKNNNSLNDNNYTVIWSKTGRQVNDWVYANVTLPIGNYIVKP